MGGTYVSKGWLRLGDLWCNSDRNRLATRGEGCNNRLIQFRQVVLNVNGLLSNGVCIGEHVAGLQSITTLLSLLVFSVNHSNEIFVIPYSSAAPLSIKSKSHIGCTLRYGSVGDPRKDVQGGT